LLPFLQTHLTIGEIGERLFISRNAVHFQIQSIYRKLGVSSPNGAAGQQATLLGPNFPRAATDCGDHAAVRRGGDRQLGTPATQWWHETCRELPEAWCQRH
jgi:DNA-binding NarL/FixJ family response regulator